MRLQRLGGSRGQSAFNTTGPKVILHFRLNRPSGPMKDLLGALFPLQLRIIGCATSIFILISLSDQALCQITRW